MITAEMKVFATGSRLDEVLRTLRWVMGQLEARSGLEQINLYRGVDREDEVVLIQRWSNREDLVQYVRSNGFLRLLAVLDLSEEPPEIHFDSVSKRQGLELVEALLPKDSVDIAE